MQDRQIQWCKWIRKQVNKTWQKSYTAIEVEEPKGQELINRRENLEVERCSTSQVEVKKTFISSSDNEEEEKWLTLDRQEISTSRVKYSESSTWWIHEEDALPLSPSIEIPT